MNPNMKTPTKRNTADDTLAGEALALMNATAEMAGERVGEIRKRLAAALESGGEMVDDLEEKVLKKAKETDKAIHRNPYEALGIAVGFGVVIGAFIGCWSTRCASTGK